MAGVNISYNQFILSKKLDRQLRLGKSCEKKSKLEKVDQTKSSHVPIAICSDSFTRFTSFVLDWKLLKLEPSMGLVLMVDSQVIMERYGW